MGIRRPLYFAIMAISLLGVSAGYSNTSPQGNTKTVRAVVASDTILSGMIASLLPPNRYSIEAILPPGHCPGHYDVKLSDIERVKKADLIVSFRGMPFMAKAGPGNKEHLLVDAGGRNWMAPDSYILAEELSKRYPDDKDEIMMRNEDTIRKVKVQPIGSLKRSKGWGSLEKRLLPPPCRKSPSSGWDSVLWGNTAGRRRCLPGRLYAYPKSGGMDTQSSLQTIFSQDPRPEKESLKRWGCRTSSSQTSHLKEDISPRSKKMLTLLCQQ
jgi:hypothetical protein